MVCSFAEFDEETSTISNLLDLFVRQCRISRRNLLLWITTIQRYKTTTNNFTILILEIFALKEIFISTNRTRANRREAVSEKNLFSPKLRLSLILLPRCALQIIQYNFLHGWFKEKAQYDSIL